MCLVTVDFLGIFSTSKKPRKLEDKVAKDGKRSCLLTEERKQLKKISQRKYRTIIVYSSKNHVFCTSASRYRQRTLFVKIL